MNDELIDEVVARMTALDPIIGDVFSGDELDGLARAAVAAVRAYDVEHGPSETETEAFYQVVIGKPSQNSIARGLKAAAVERAHQTEGVGE